MLRGSARRAVGAMRGVASQVDPAGVALRRAAFVARIRAAAAWNHASVDVDIADDIVLGHRVRVTFQPWSENRLRIGPGCRLEDGVLIQLKGGTVVLGERVELRRDVVLNVAGRLEMQGDNPVSWNTVIHCSNEVTLGRMAGLAEQVTIADSSHYFTTPDEHFWHNVRVGSVSVGYNTWICPKVTLARGAAVGAHCIVGSNSVVVGAVPDGSLASGVPAEVRTLSLPWRPATP
jgi:acetyltransferase-like isoleucine patch superfamily enzyme